MSERRTLLAARFHGQPVGVLEVADLRIVCRNARRGGVSRAGDEALDLVLVWGAPVGTKVVAAQRPRSERVRGHAALGGVIRLSAQPLRIIRVYNMARRARRKSVVRRHCHQ